MAMLADTVELVIGVDTHKHTHTAAVLAAATGAMIAQATMAATPGGYRRLLALADQQPGQRVWAIEGTGGYGAGLTRFLQANAEQVVELDRPKRAARRHGAKSDPLDATRAAREALGRDQLAQPPSNRPRAALSVRLAARRSAVQAAGDAQRQLRALVIAAPDVLRERLRIPSTRQLVAACVRLRVQASWDVETATTAATLRSLARRIRELTSEAADQLTQYTSVCGNDHHTAAIGPWCRMQVALRPPLGLRAVLAKLPPLRETGVRYSREPVDAANRGFAQGFWVAVGLPAALASAAAQTVTARV
jgi:transposase